jgi:hypothetical protein
LIVFQQVIAHLAQRAVTANQVVSVGNDAG